MAQQVNDPACRLLTLVGPGGVDALRGRKQLLVLDNLEQLAGELTTALVALLRGAPGLTLLVTSREVLRLPEEWLWTVGGLELPAGDDPAVVVASDAGQLFVARARQRGGERALSHELGAVARICRLVGGMPLALELAAEIAAGAEVLATNHQGVPERHRSLQIVLAQTWAGLAPGLRLAMAHPSAYDCVMRRAGSCAM